MTTEAGSSIIVGGCLLWYQHEKVAQSLQAIVSCVKSETDKSCAKSICLLK
jgi:hypothetical protein